MGDFIHQERVYKLVKKEAIKINLFVFLSAAIYNLHQVCFKFDQHFPQVIFYELIQLPVLQALYNI